MAQRNRTRPHASGRRHQRPQPRQRRRTLSLNTKFTFGLVAAVLIIVTGVFVINGSGNDDPGKGLLVREQSHFLSNADDGVTIVEFLDFECPACGLAHSEIDRLLAEYGGRITYVVRQFPLPQHRNGDSSARAAQAAAVQGRFKDMYDMLFSNQATWANQSRDHSALFESYAAQLGLDMTRFRSDVSSSETARQIQVDIDDGRAIGITGTPTFFFNGQRFDGAPTYVNFKAAIDAVLNR